MLEAEIWRNYDFAAIQEIVVGLPVKLFHFMFKTLSCSFVFCSGIETLAYPIFIMNLSQNY